MVDKYLQFNPEKLYQPFEILNMNRLPQVKRFAHFLFYFWGTVKGTYAIGSLGAKFSNKKTMSEMNKSVGMEIAS